MAAFMDVERRLLCNTHRKTIARQTAVEQRAVKKSLHSSRDRAGVLAVFMSQMSLWLGASWLRICDREWSDRWECCSCDRPINLTVSQNVSLRWNKSGLMLSYPLWTFVLINWLELTYAILANFFGLFCHQTSHWLTQVVRSMPQLSSIYPPICKNWEQRSVVVMGVTGLWQVLEPVGRPVRLETLEGKVLAVDILLCVCQFPQYHCTFAFANLGWQSSAKILPAHSSVTFFTSPSKVQTSRLQISTVLNNISSITCISLAIAPGWNKSNL